VSHKLFIQIQTRIHHTHTHTHFTTNHSDSLVRLCSYSTYADILAGSLNLYQQQQQQQQQ